MQLAINSRENPERAVVSWNGRRGVERRRRLLLADSRDQCAGKEISRWREEGGKTWIVCLQRPRIIAWRTIHRKRSGIRAAADEAGKICVEKMVLAKHDSSAKIARQGMRVADRQRLPRNPASIFEFVLRN